MTVEQLSAAPTQRREKLPFGRRVRAFFVLTKPQIIELLLVTTVPVMILAQGGFPNLLVMLGVFVGGAMSAGSANVFNCYIDRDIDRVMKRTEKRPLVTGEVTDREALVFAWALGVLSTIILFVAGGWLAAALSIAAILMYVVGYTLILKRHTEQNIVWGGLAGCMPVFIGWAAIRGTLEWPAVILFLVVFLWTPAHYWPLSVKYRDDYARAGVPMLSVTEGTYSVSLQTVLYAWATVVCSLLLIPVAHMGWLYSAVALGSGAWFIWESHVLYHRVTSKSGREAKPMKVFTLSITYLTLLFIAVGVDPFTNMLFSNLGS